jgi:fatty acid desaturase
MPPPRKETVSKPAPEPSMVELAELTARRRAPSSPRQKRQLREMRRVRIAVAVLAGSAAIYLWLLLA